MTLPSIPDFIAGTLGGGLLGATVGHKIGHDQGFVEGQHYQHDFSFAAGRDWIRDVEVKPLTAEVNLLKGDIGQRDRRINKLMEENSKLKEIIAEHGIDIPE